MKLKGLPIKSMLKVTTWEREYEVATDIKWGKGDLHAAFRDAEAAVVEQYRQDPDFSVSTKAKTFWKGVDDRGEEIVVVLVVAKCRQEHES